MSRRAATNRAAGRRAAGRLRVACLAVLVAVLPCRPGPARAAESVEAAQPNAPFAMMRRLQLLQEQIAQGNAAAQAAQPKLMSHIADVFLAADPELWRDPRNGRAAVLFLLSGGRPSVIRAIMVKANMPAELDPLLKGALAYGEGQDDVARALFRTIDPAALPTSLGGHVALIEATLLADSDASKAESLLDLARLLVPGTLVEEAALRRQIFMLADRGSLTKFVLLSRQYARRFRGSIYAANFKQRFITAGTALAMKGDAAALATLDGAVGDFTPAEQRGFYVHVARTAVAGGRTVAARFAAEKAVALAPDGSPDAIRCKVYLGAALVVSDAIDEGVKLLEAADPARLDPDDADIRRAALAVAQAVRDDGGPVDPAATSPADGDATALLQQGRRSIADSDTLLEATP